jgi:hypothetical protein
MTRQDGAEAQERPVEAPAVAFSNGIRLTPREWLVVAAFAAVLVSLAPVLWYRAEKFALAPDYRMPPELGNDYWLYACVAQQAAEHCDFLLIGDSVIWGEYVTREQTLSHELNKLIGQGRCANLGLDGAHPLALGGLVEFYADAVSGKNVVLHCNPLWVSSRRTDLQDDKGGDFNHPRLVPQFAPSVPAYKAEVSARLGILVERRLPLSRWASHLQQAYYGQAAIPAWTLEHPYKNPVTPLFRGLPAPDNSLRYPSRPWYKSGVSRQDYHWVDLDTSLQWRAFRGLVKLLQERGNRVFVLVGPFNEHLLTPRSRTQYELVKATIASWLSSEKIPHAVPDPLPSELYGDATHPLAEGYKQLARQLAEEPFFRSRVALGSARKRSERAGPSGSRTPQSF